MPRELSFYQMSEFDFKKKAHESVNLQDLKQVMSEHLN